MKEIIKDESFLSQKSLPATEDDFAVAEGLLDTLHLKGLRHKLFGTK